MFQTSLFSPTRRRKKYLDDFFGPIHNLFIMLNITTAILIIFALEKECCDCKIEPQQTFDFAKNSAEEFNNILKSVDWHISELHRQAATWPIPVPLELANQAAERTHIIWDYG